MNGENCKNRELSVAEYFVQIQKEYLIAVFRSKVYFSPKDKRYWRKVADYKAEKIKSISERNGLFSVLNSDKKLKEFNSRLFDANGKPCFEFSSEDIKNYFTVGNEFSYNGEIYVLEAICEDEKLKLYSVDKRNYVIVDRADVCRII